MTSLVRAGAPAAAIAALLLCAAPASATAQTAPAPAADTVFQATTLDLSAYGEVRVAPDMASIDLGVTTDGATAAEALSANAAQMTAVVAALKKAGVEARDIQTSNIGLQPQYVYVQNQPPKLTGYQASNSVTVTERNLGHLGATVDAVVGAGATNVGSISFGLIAPLSAENAAREAAVKALQDKAALYADATGYRIRRLVNLSEGVAESGVTPRRVYAMARLEAAAPPPPTPVEAGQVKVRVDVTGLFELTH
ncbi:MAG: SIMPL domain-containing protein [Caulobacterales bacterium]